MKSTFAKIAAAAVTVALMGTMPVTTASAQSMGSTQVQNAQFSFGFSSGNTRDYRSGFERRGNNHYYNGYRGYRDHRAGYRQYNGFWFPQSAFSFSFSIGNDRGSVRLSSKHVNWCENRYRSYRASDNTFQPYNGPRQQCYSPYWRG